ncbi:gamma-aminobutyraldehyde dehydrogenase [Nakamurella flava]|uniref:Salicylaldehyde dehydrogenase n=1 Tax=Nakamurella flava TaxID=2576308 RepID=A0A4U6QG77_9ACTN|nr:gamma-aminobutyraldehyde dehydrogenase [Nakamurella flava]TKV59243.1 gamma-aminobutyraldehyde dehydrogenase [Nakamurella flava]
MTGQTEAKKTFTNIIGGQPVPAADGSTMDVLDPTTGAVYATAPQSAAEDVDRAYAAASKAYETWRWATPSERQLGLLKFADHVEANAEELVAVEVQDTGKPSGLTMSEEIGPMVDQLRFFAGAARVLEGRSSGEYLRGHTSSIRREPVGVVGQVSPWNYPMMMAVWKLAPALAAGCSVVIKPSDTTPASTVWMVNALQEFYPPGVVNVVCGDRDTGAALTSHAAPALVSITGSTRAGIAVATAAAKNLTRSHLELGGKAPVVVFDDASIEAAVEGIATAGYFNGGQDCTAATRVIAQAGIYDDFVAALTAKAKETRTGAPDDEDVLYGSINNANQLNHIAGLVERAAQSADVTAGGTRIDGPGFYYPPTVVAGVHQDDEIVQTEVFGPVITVQKFADESEALRAANGTEYGLASSVWTTNIDTAARMSAQLDFGCVWINTHIPLVAEMPHGGFKKSGYGKDLSMYGFEDYTRIKHVMHYHGLGA